MRIINVDSRCGLKMQIKNMDYKCQMPISTVDYENEFQIWISNIENVFRCGL